MKKLLLGALVASTLLSSACSEKPADDRTLQALEAEAARGAKEGPHDRLANLAAGKEHTSLRDAALNVSAQKIGEASVRPTALRIVKSISNGKLAITSEERFFLVTVEVTAPVGTPLRYEDAVLVDTAGNAWELARDAQRLVRQAAAPSPAPVPEPAMPVPAAAPPPEPSEVPSDDPARAEAEEKRRAQAAKAAFRERKVAPPQVSEIVLAFEVPESIKEENLSLNLESAAFRLFP